MVDVVFTHSDGRVQRVQDKSPVNTRRGAEEHERQIRQALQSGTYGQEEAPKVPTLAEFKGRFLTWSENNNKPSQVHAKTLVLKNHLEPAFGKMRLDAISIPDIENFKAEQTKASLNKKTVNNHLAILRKLLNVAADYGLIEKVPRFKMFRVEKHGWQFLDFAEASRFLRAAQPEWKAFLSTAIKTGLRAGELLALRWEDVDLNAGKVIVRRTLWRKTEGSPKGGKLREVPLSPDAVKVLRDHWHLKSDYVFCTETGARLTHSRLKDIVPRTCKRASLAKRLRLHDLRHTFASHLVMSGAHIVAVKELLGHADIATTMIYAHLAPSVHREAVARLDLPYATTTQQAV